jgi:polyferredoxin
MTEQELNRILAESICRVAPDGTLIHPGLPSGLGIAVIASMFLVGAWGLCAPVGSGILMPRTVKQRFADTLPGTRGFILAMTPPPPWVLTLLKFVTVVLFLTVIWAGLAGTPVPERNLATVLTWNLWWSGVIISVFFLGSAWCAVCPWDALSSWLVRRRLWGRAAEGSSLDLRVPKVLRNVWPALALFVALTWLELGVGITKDPYATSVLALSVLVLAIAAMATFERKAFCRFACPVGRTVGFYSQLSPVELRPVDTDICANCKTLECYYGTSNVDPCPTHQVMGRLKQNTFCTSCGNCSRACPHDNVGWRLRPPSSEAVHGARPHWDESWFMLGLLALTGFHGLTMLESWEGWTRQLARFIGDSGQLLWSFSISMSLAILVPVALYVGAVRLVQLILGAWANCRLSFTDVFTRFSFIALPLAFAYHLAHNLSHLLREGIGAGGVVANPLGLEALPLSVYERHQRMTEMALAPTALATIQALLLALGFLVAVLVIRRRGAALLEKGSTSMGQAKATLLLAPVIIFAAAMTALHLWLLMQPMVMRM